jgi:serine phosphatase RsbU (regulator of sigma subunit)
MEVFYEPFRAVGGDYFDVIELPGNRTLFAIADVSGKGSQQPCSRPTFKLSSGALQLSIRNH